MEPKISVIIPIYNAEKYIKKCIDSIRKQTLREIEIILVDDGSNDNSPDICDYYSQIDKRIKVIHIKNNGVSNARNMGIKLAKGRYIMFSDSDDYVNSAWCETLYKLAENNRDDFIVCGYEIINNRNNNYRKKNILSDLKNENIFLPRKDFYKLYSWQLLNSPCNKIFDIEKIKKHNILYKQELSLGEDMIFNLDYLNVCSGNIKIINKSLYYYVNDDKESLDNKYYDNLFEIYRELFKKINHSMEILGTDYDKYKKDINLDYFYLIEKVLTNTLNKKNKDSFFNKLKYNNYILSSKDCRMCVSNLETTYIRKSYIFLLKKEKYIYIFLYNKLVSSLYKIKKLMKRYKEKI